MPIAFLLCSLCKSFSLGVEILYKWRGDARETELVTYMIPAPDHRFAERISRRAFGEWIGPCIGRRPWMVPTHGSSRWSGLVAARHAACRVRDATTEPPMTRRTPFRQADTPA